MKKRTYFSIITASLCVLALCGGCSEEALTQNGTASEGLVLSLEVGGEPATSVVTRAASDPDLNETLVETVDVFFLQGDKVQHRVHSTVTNGKATLASGTWKNDYQGMYDIYVLANLHTYDNPLTTEKETDLSWVTNKDHLLTLKDTDVNICRAEGEKRGEETYTGKLFLMDGKFTEWDADAQGSNASITVNLSHAAAKLVVNLKYTEAFVTEGRQIVSVSKKLVRYTQDAKALSDGGTIASVELPVQGDASDSGFSATNSSNGEAGTARTDKLYAYSYPNEWGSDIAERETYFLVNVSYIDNEHSDMTNNYYKVPLRVSGNTADLKLDRNMEYTINVTVDRLGNESVDTPEELKPEIIIQSWKESEIPVDGSTPNYLMLSEDYIEMNAVADTTITFFSSSAIDVKVTEAYYIYKDGTSRDINTTGLISTDYDQAALQGSLKIHSAVPTNVTARYITLEVTNTDGLTKTISIVQYPLEYISGVPGVYATRSDFEETGNTYENYANGTSVSSNVKLNTGGNNPTFQSKVYDDGTYYVTRSNNNKLSHGRSSVSSLSNNRMYLVQITSTSGGHTVARPAMEGTGEDIVTQSNDENNRLVSPMFMLASQLGAVQTANWTTAQAHCKQYVEVAKYKDGTTKRFADWRLPTFAELQVIAQYQNEQPEVMDEVLGGEYYWSARQGHCIIRVYESEWWGGGSYTDDWESEPSTDRSSCYIRCIRDVSPEDLEEFRAHGVK